MKKLHFIFLLILLVGCGSSKKTTKSSAISETQSLKSELKTDRFESIIDTTRTSTGSMIITEIEFELNADDENTDLNQNNSVDLSGIGKFPSGKIKSFRQAVFSSEIELKGISNEQIDSNIQSMEAVNQNSSEIKSDEIKPVPDPYRWRYIFGILLLALILLFVTKNPLKKWIGKIMGEIIRKFIN